MMMWLLVSMPCALSLHAPDGSDLVMETTTIAAVRPVTPALAPHIAKGSKSIIYTAGGRFGVTETTREIAIMARQCEANERK